MRYVCLNGGYVTNFGKGDPLISKSILTLPWRHNRRDGVSEIGEKIILELPSKNSCGSDGLSTNFLKKISKIIAAPLSVIISLWLQKFFMTSFRLQKWFHFSRKEMTMCLIITGQYLCCPLSRKLSKNSFYSGLRLFFKTEYVIWWPVWLSKNTFHLAAVELVDRIRLYMDKGQIPLSVYLDLSKAFDTLDHSILLTKLNFYGFSGSPLMCFQSHLSHRQQFVDFDGTVSDICTLSTGVPQGSILGTLLFIIYNYDIHITSEQFNLILYADDTNMISPLCSFSSQIALQSISMTQISHNVNVELNNIQEWLSIKKTSLNFKKTKFMIFHYRQRNIDNLILDLQIRSEKKERVAEFNFLGLTVDENLNWNAHIQTVSNKISRTLGVHSSSSPIWNFNWGILPWTAWKTSKTIGTHNY